MVDCYIPWKIDKTPLEWYQEIDEDPVHSMQQWATRYATAIYLATHPRVNIQFEKSEKMWPYGAVWQHEKLITALASGEAPAWYGLGAITGSIEGDIMEGYAADITDLVNNWDQKDFLMKHRWGVWHRAWREGHCYGVPPTYWVYAAFTYRKDYFKEAGIFDEKGNPAPPLNWTTDDFKNICLKLTNPKKKRWAFSILNAKRSMIERFFDIFGVPLVIPDKSGKQTWKSGINIPEAMSVWNFYQYLVKNNCILVGEAGEFKGSDELEMVNGRIAMTRWTGISSAIWRAIMSKYADPMFFHLEGTPKDLPFYKAAGVALFPKGPEGINISTVSSGGVAFNPSLSKDQLKAAFDLQTNLYGGGIGYVEKIKAKGIGAYGGKYIEDSLKTYRLPAEVLTLDKTLPEWDKITKIEETLPIQPTAGEFGLPVILEDSMASIVDLVIHEPNIDLNKELNKAADRINKGVLNYKAGGNEKKKFEDYYTALGEFYKKNFPGYYKNTYVKLLEKYYKVW